MKLLQHPTSMYHFSQRYPHNELKPSWLSRGMHRTSIMGHQPPRGWGYAYELRCYSIALNLTNWKLQQWRWYHSETSHFWESQNRYATNSSPKNVLLPHTTVCMEIGEPILIIQAPTYHAAAVGYKCTKGIPASIIMHRVTDGYIRMQFLWHFHHPFLSI